MEGCNECAPASLSHYEEIDHSLGFIGPCKIGFRGLCWVNVNGTDVMACQRVIPEEDKEITLRLLSRHLVLRDLVVNSDRTWTV